MPARRSLALLALLVVAVSGCETTGTPIGGEAELSPEERRLQAVEDKLAELDRRADSTQGISQDILLLREEVRELRGAVERLRYDVDSQGSSAKQLFADLDRRVAALEGVNSPVVGATGNGAVPGTLTAVTPQRPAVASPEEEAAYLHAFDLLKNGKYDAAIRDFKNMLGQWPRGRYADNAWYWMGEAYYVKRDYDAAVDSFRSLVQAFPDSPKMPDGLYKLGLALLEKQQQSEARAALQRVVSEYPNTNAANLARQKLQQIGA